MHLFKKSGPLKPGVIKMNQTTNHGRQAGCRVFHSPPSDAKLCPILFQERRGGGGFEKMIPVSACRLKPDQTLLGPGYLHPGTGFFPAVLLFLLIAFISIAFPNRCPGQSPDQTGIRPSVLSGTWYPANRAALGRSIKGYLSAARRTVVDGPIKGLLVPHAGHQYSGKVAAAAYRHLEGRNLRRIILIGPTHRVAFRGISASLHSGYQTPLGIVPVDQAFSRRLIDDDPEIRWLPRAHAAEHCLEIQLPFLQTVLKDFSIVPILMGGQDPETCRRLARSLLRVIRSEQGTLLLASSDLSHFHNAERAEALDRVFIDAVRSFDPWALSRSLASGKCEACGGGPAVVVMSAAAKLGADRAIILDYAHSGHVTGDHRQVVGYLSAAFVSSRDAP